MNRPKKTMMLVNLTDLRKKILVLSVACVSVRAHVIHLYTIWGPFPYKFMSTIAVCCQHFLTIKRTVTGE